jgi:hypothetical protein
MQGGFYEIGTGKNKMKKILILSIFLLYPSFFIFSQHASILDVFNQGTQLTTQVLDTLSRMKREEDDKILFWINQDLEIESSRFLLSLYSQTDFNSFFPLWYERRDSLFFVHLDRISGKYAFDSLNYIYGKNDVSLTREINKLVLQKWEDSGMQENIEIFSYRPLPTLQNQKSENRGSVSDDGEKNTDWIWPAILMSVITIVGGAVILSL